MISEYHRPKTLPEALGLIARTLPLTRPLGGGTVLNRPSPDKIAVVDLQELGLNKITKSGNFLEIGATSTLQALNDCPYLPEALKQTLRLEANYNLRQMATVAGTLVSADGRSAFTTAMLALDVKITIMGKPTKEEDPLSTVITLGDMLPLRHDLIKGKLITKITLPLSAKLAFEWVSRTPSDWPIVSAALAMWPSRRTRLALGGWGAVPLLAMDGNEPGGVKAAAGEAAATAGDEWASAEYRAEMAGVLVKRALVKIDGMSNP